ncbi:MAG: hypothetical protein N3E41_08565 [Thermofilaceae archaeon]|nr:hypothetical protein [Thermofilaceae archaeon]
MYRITLGYFQFFPSCIKEDTSRSGSAPSASLSILSQLHLDEEYDGQQLCKCSFNSFPVASAQQMSGLVERCSAFNSFPVASPMKGLRTC